MDQPTSEDQQQHPVDSVTPSDPSSGQAVAEEQADAVVKTSADVPPPQAVESLSETTPVADAPPMETDAVVENGEKKAVPESTESELKEAGSEFCSEVSAMQGGPLLDVSTALSPRALELFSRFADLPPVEKKRLVFSLLTASDDLSTKDFREIEECDLGINDDPEFTQLVEMMKQFAHNREEFLPLWSKMFEVTHLADADFAKNGGSY